MKRRKRRQKEENERMKGEGGRGKEEKVGEQKGKADTKIKSRVQNY